MSLALITSAALIGLAGTPHCAGMCAAGCATAASRCAAPVESTSSPHLTRGLALVLLGRALGYTAAGAAVASAAEALRWLGDSVAWLRPGWAALQFAALLLGMSLLWRGRLPVAVLGWMDTLRAAISPAGQPLTAATPPSAGWTRIRLPGEAQSFALGTLWPAIPCGLLHAALLIAALANGPLGGAAVMLGFALTSSLGLVFGQALWRWLGRRMGRRNANASAHGNEDALALRLVGAMLVAMLGWSVFQTLWTPLQAWCA